MTDKFEEIKITTDFITLGQFLKYVGIIDEGFMAKDFILNNSIFVNGDICTQRGKKLYPETKVIINNSKFFEIKK